MSEIAHSGNRNQNELFISKKSVRDCKMCSTIKIHVKNLITLFWVTLAWGGGGQRGVHFMWPMEPKEREDGIAGSRNKHHLLSPLVSAGILSTWLPNMFLAYGAMVYILGTHGSRYTYKNPSTWDSFLLLLTFPPCLFGNLM